jgi:hypothetical protein
MEYQITGLFIIGLFISGLLVILTLFFLLQLIIEENEYRVLSNTFYNSNYNKETKSR